MWNCLISLVLTFRRVRNRWVWKRTISYVSNTNPVIVRFLNYIVSLYILLTLFRWNVSLVGQCNLVPDKCHVNAKLKSAGSEQSAQTCVYIYKPIYKYVFTYKHPNAFAGTSPTTQPVDLYGKQGSCWFSFNGLLVNFLTQWLPYIYVYAT